MTKFCPNLVNNSWLWWIMRFMPFNQSETRKYYTLNVWCRGKQLVLFSRESWWFPRRRAGNNCAIVSQSGYIWIWSEARDQESTNHSAHFVEWKSSSITIWINIYVAYVCSRYHTSSKQLILGHYSPVMPTGYSRPQSLGSFWPAAGIESSGSNHFEITKEITEFCPSGFKQSASWAYAWNGCSQSSRFLPQARRIVGSGDSQALEYTSD